MLKNYLTVALRILIRQKTYSGINVLGLTTGVTASLLILLYVMDELSYDKFHPDADRIYRVSFTAKIQDQNINTTLTGLPLAAGLMEEATGIESVTRLDKWMTCPVQYEDKTFTEMNLILADSNFFSFFNFNLLAGNPEDVLHGPKKIVISESAAVRYFGYTGHGDRSPIGKTMIIGSTGDVTAEVTGIVEDAPSNSHFHFDFIMSLENSGYYNNPIWLNTEVYTYFKVYPDTDISSIQSTLDGFIEKYCAIELQQFLNITLDQFFGTGGKMGFGIQPLTRIHLHSSLGDEFEPNGNAEYVWLFCGIAAFILLLACINFMNLSTARSALRAKEIGIRKAIGAVRTRLVRQFMIESFLYTCIAFLLSLVFAYGLLTSFNTLSGKELTVGMLLQPVFIVGYLILMIVIGVLAGSYPALYLTGFNPVEVLKSKKFSKGSRSGIRNALVVFQFCISIMLIIASVMVYRQLSFLQEQNLGFDKSNVVGLMHTMNLGNDAEVFRNEILSHPEFAAASYSNRLPPDIDWFATFLAEGKTENHLMGFYSMDYDHQDVMGFTMKEGRFFSRDFPSDTLAVILNEAAMRVLGFDSFEGKKIRPPGEGPSRHVIGVVNDFNFETLKTSIRPLVLTLGPTPNWDIAVKLTPGDVGRKIELLGTIWKKFVPGAPYEYSFISQNFDAKFRAEQRLGDVILVFTGLAIFIACLGLFGLATFTAEQRSKEIGIRKVLGASVSQVVALLSNDFIRLILISFVIAIPLTWYGMNQWLEGYAYRVEFSVFVVLIAGAAVFGVALLTVSVQSVKAAIQNPVNALKQE